eukprot:TRINITY_DN851_c0_g1_i13.p1 TRINITY_DN851_c0_g1~~TRINITY_DN851_c0_g1_i13.p1  ORF type:complete len:174 (-),score=1.44 TRINITY_DN851_c0_g1_i13:209-730(-)
MEGGCKFLASESGPEACCSQGFMREKGVARKAGILRSRPSYQATKLQLLRVINGLVTGKLAEEFNNNAVYFLPASPIWPGNRSQFSRYFSMRRVCGWEGAELATVVECGLRSDKERSSSSNIQYSYLHAQKHKGRIGYLYLISNRKMSGSISDFVQWKNLHLLSSSSTTITIK